MLTATGVPFRIFDNVPRGRAPLQYGAIIQLHLETNGDHASQATVVEAIDEIVA